VAPIDNFTLVSPFLEIPSTDWFASNALAFAIRDRYPVSPGHTLVITRRLVADWFLATADEQAAVLALVADVKRMLDAELQPHGYNVGFNAGIAAGQTVMHLHVHVIPRYRGDVDDPRGGVRHVIPTKANYLRAEPLAVGGEKDPFARHIAPLFDSASEIAIVAAFVQESGLDRIRKPLLAAVDRGAYVRILTGDYLDITQASALETLLDWCATVRGGAELDADSQGSGRLEARIIETARLPGLSRSFHPKSWRFQSPAYGVAFVGSSNLSRSALDSGIEWNLRVDRERDAHAYARVREAFEALWGRGRILDEGWVTAYAERARTLAQALPPGEVDAEPLAPAPDPHVVQLEALEKLRQSRKDGRRRALVVLATGLGKTWLAAFDMAQLRDEIGVRPRVLFVAHRVELLRQAAQTYRRLMRMTGMKARVGWFVGDEGDLSADLVFASVAKLARPQNIEKLKAERFDYIVIDEVHHAAADSYRRILDVIDPTFLLGLTATPDRADSSDILGLFDDHVAYRADIARGVEIGRLVPFHYFGVKDDIDYSNIPWRNKRFDPETLASALQTEARMETLWRAWGDHPGTRTLVFCCSIAHAEFVRSWLRARGVRANAVYSAEGSDDRDDAIRLLGSGDIDALCSVDVFNEGVDVPAVDRVVMLRPTESGVIFLQQLGRGLRAADAKTSVTVIDFVGNHTVFLERLRALLSLGGRTPPTVREVLAAEEAIDLPAGCSVDLSLEAKEILSRLFRVGGADEVERTYRELRLERDGERPTAGELERLGYPPARLRARHGGWVDFVRAEKDLTPDEESAVAAGGGFLREVEVTEMTKCFKMVTLEALLEADALTTGLPLRDLALRSHALLRRSPELFADVAEDERVTDLDATAEKRWLAYWRRNPIEAWTAEKKERRSWFRVSGDRFMPAFAVSEDAAAAFSRLTRELTDYRLAQYRARRRHDDASAESFVCRVLSNKRDPILKLPSAGRDKLPSGEVDVRVDGVVWQFRMMKEFCNVARPAGVASNALPDLLRRWFGPRAGQPGTAFDVRFRGSPDGYWAEPVQGSVIALPPRNGVVAYPDLRAAAGHGLAAEGLPTPEHVSLPVASPEEDLFAVRVAGTSMDGGKSPLRDGDWAVMRLARSAPASSMLNRVVLVQAPGDGAGVLYQIKRLGQADGAWKLTSDNPAGPTFDATADTTVIARLEQSFHPNDLGPSVGVTLSEAELSGAFGLDELVPASGRYGGHLFIFIDAKGILRAPDEVRETRVTRRTAETAFVLAKRPDGAFRYLGVGRWIDDDAAWRITDADYETWRTWGEGRETSRRLPDGSLARAQLVVDALLTLPESERWLDQGNGRRARVLGPTSKGGFRIDGGDQGFAERTVSTTDVAWVVVAADDARERGGTLDEARINLLRYLEGTPKGSTRWIDSRWALAAWQKASSLVRAATVDAGGVRSVHGEDGRALDATFRVQPVGTTLAVIIESGGGTRDTKAARNRDYAAGFALILKRLGDAGLRIGDALVDSGQVAKLSDTERRLGVVYPIVIGDADALRKQLGQAMARTGRKEGARGSGNAEKRLRLVVEKTDLSASALAELLAGGPAAH
jgi:superfamily II DNA or RNA helicase/diadenosine tetraphosphate (Ap4A) HIT family hydrolase